MKWRYKLAKVGHSFTAWIFAGSVFTRLLPEYNQKRLLKESGTHIFLPWNITNFPGGVSLNTSLTSVWKTTGGISETTRYSKWLRCAALNAVFHLSPPGCASGQWESVGRAVTSEKLICGLLADREWKALEGVAGWSQTSLKKKRK